MDDARAHKFDVVDLIDTLWNVKTGMLMVHNVSGYGFNRYIVECKEKWTREEIAAYLRFNRYIVECKGRAQKADGRTSGFNRYIVECKVLI